jgi:integrase
LSIIVRKPQNKRKPWVVRYQQDGKQRERGFSTKAEATAYKTDLDHGQRYGSEVDSKADKTAFGVACEAWIANVAVNDRSRESYSSAYSKHIRPLFGAMSIVDVAKNRDMVVTLLNTTMGELSLSPRRQVRMIITQVLDEATVAGKIGSHRIAGIKLTEPTVKERDEDDEDEAIGFVHVSDKDVAILADHVGIVVWLQRTMGLRISEARGVEKSDFKVRNGKRFLHLTWQATRDGKNRVPLKKRKAGEYRDIPVPDMVWNLVKDLPDGPLCPGKSTRYVTYAVVWQKFSRSCTNMGITGFTTHSLRHAFATDALNEGMNIVDLANVLGHADPSVTLRIYVHAMPDAFDRTQAMMNARWALRAA